MGCRVDGWMCSAVGHFADDLLAAGWSNGLMARLAGEPRIIVIDEFAYILQE